MQESARRRAAHQTAGKDTASAVVSPVPAVTAHVAVQTENPAPTLPSTTPQPADQGKTRGAGAPRRRGRRRGPKTKKQATKDGTPGGVQSKRRKQGAGSVDGGSYKPTSATRGSNGAKGSRPAPRQAVAPSTPTRGSARKQGPGTMAPPLQAPASNAAAPQTSDGRPRRRRGRPKKVAASSQPTPSASDGQDASAPAGPRRGQRQRKPPQRFGQS